MWIQGSQIIKRWNILPQELLGLYEDCRLIPCNRLNKEHMEENELRALVADPDDLMDFSPQKTLREALIKSFYREEEVRECMKSLDVEESPLLFPQLNEKDREAVTAVLLHESGKTWSEIAHVFWPKDFYENGNSVHKRVERLLKRGREIMKK